MREEEQNLQSAEEGALLPSQQLDTPGYYDPLGAAWFEDITQTSSFGKRVAELQT